MTTIDSKTVRIMLVDDHTVVRAGLRMLIESRPGLHVVGEAATTGEALTVAAQAQPDIILLDLDLGGDSGLDILPELFTTAKQARVLMLTGVRDPEEHHRAVRLGAMGVVVKEKAADDLLKAIEKVHAGEVWLDGALMARVLGRSGPVGEMTPVNPETARINSLTEREREVIALICEGLQNKLIGERLFISETTVRHHLTSIFDKLGVTNRLELVIYAYRHGLAKLPR
ncbi:MAG: response regulator transcription factor [Chloroflexi bacterium]|nr:response regulator transcription factor [Chloroflexota bacterium]